MPILELRNVSFSYGGSNEKVLDNVNFLFEEGKVYLLSGPNGIGKTTLINLISGNLPNEEEGYLTGTLIFSDNNTDASHRKRLTTTVQQNLSLFDNLTIEENFLITEDLDFYKLRNPRREFYADTLKKIGCNISIDYYVGELSFANKQKVEIARSLSRREKPKLIILDEATTSLTDEERKALFEIIKKLATDDKITFILISHDDPYIDLINPLYITIENNKISNCNKSIQSQYSSCTSSCLIGNKDEIHFRFVRKKHNGQIISSALFEIYEKECTLIYSKYSNERAAFVNAWLSSNPNWQIFIDPDGHKTKWIEKPGFNYKREIRVLTMDRLKNCGFPSFSLELNFCILSYRLHLFDKRNKGKEQKLLKNIINSLDVKNQKKKIIPNSTTLNELSGGNKQRFLLGSICNYDARIIVLEEPLTGIDDKSYVLIFDYLKSYIENGGRIIIVTCHPLSYSQLSINRTIDIS